MAEIDNNIMIMEDNVADNQENDNSAANDLASLLCRGHVASYKPVAYQQKSHRILKIPDKALHKVGGTTRSCDQLKEKSHDNMNAVNTSKILSRAMIMKRQQAGNIKKLDLTMPSETKTIRLSKTRRQKPVAP